jgi:hypothetical protein
MNNEETRQPTRGAARYAAHLLKRLIDPAGIDPAAADLKRLTGPLFEVVIAVMGEGRDREKRKARLNAELTARELERFLQPEIDLADPRTDLASLSLSSGWQFFDLADVRNEDIPPIEWIVKHFVSKPSVTVFFGRPKHKKTLVVLDMCHHIASGLPWMISKPTSQDGIDITPVRVLWVDLENGVRLLKRRMRAFDSALGAPAPQYQFRAVSMPDPWLDLSKPENIPVTIERIQELGNIGVMVLDHLGMVFGTVDENSPLASQIMGAIRYISEACNIAIVLIHHAKKGAGKDGGFIEDQLRGSGAILAGVDGAFLIERDKSDKDQVTIKPVAVRGPDAPNISAQFSYEQDENLDLTSARFWRIAYRSQAARARDAILQALRDKSELNHTQLRAEAKRIDMGLSDAVIRAGIATLEGTLEIGFLKAEKGAKIYQLTGGDDDD